MFWLTCSKVSTFYLGDLRFHVFYNSALAWYYSSYPLL